MNSPAKVATLLCFCSKSWYPWQTAWIQSSCLQMMPLLLPGVTRVCQIIESQLRTLPSWPPVSVGHSSLSHSNRASNGFGTGSAQIWGWCSEGKSEYQNICRGTQNLNTLVCFTVCAFLPEEVPSKLLPLLLKQEGDYWNGNIKIRASWSIIKNSMNLAQH